MSKQAFILFRNKLIDALNKNADWQASKASGSADAYIKSDESAVITDSKFIQYGLGYTPFIDAGRPNGGVPPVKNIFDWLSFKKYSLNYENDKQRWGIAWAIAKKQEKEGSFKFRGNQTNVFEQVIKEATPTLFQALEDESRVKFQESIVSEIKRINDIER